MPTEIPLKAALPAAAAAAAYVNARWYLSHDFWLLKGLFELSLVGKRLDRQDRVNLFYKLEEHAQNSKLSKHNFLVYEGRTWTFKEAYDVTLQYGSWFRARYSITPKQVVALDYMNSPEYLFMIFGLWSIGAVPALINYNLSGKALAHCVRTSGASLMLVDPEVRENFTPETLQELNSPDFHGEGGGGVEIRFHDQSLEQEIARVPAQREPDSSRSGAGINEGDRTAALIYTSGTTGLPKAAISK